MDQKTKDWIFLVVVFGGGMLVIRLVLDYLKAGW